MQKTIYIFIVSCYYYQAGAIENSFRHDKQIKAAIALLRDPAKYSATLAPEEKKAE